MPTEQQHYNAQVTLHCKITIDNIFMTVTQLTYFLDILSPRSYISNLSYVNVGHENDQTICRTQRICRTNNSVQAIKRRNAMKKML